MVFKIAQNLKIEKRLFRLYYKYLDSLGIQEPYVHQKVQITLRKFVRDRDRITVNLTVRYPYQ